MYVCVCSAVTERDIDAAVRDGVETVEQLCERLNACAGCGTCSGWVAASLEQAIAQSGRIADPVPA